MSLGIAGWGWGCGGGSGGPEAPALGGDQTGAGGAGGAGGAPSIRRDGGAAPSSGGESGTDAASLGGSAGAPRDGDAPLAPDAAAPSDAANGSGGSSGSSGNPGPGPDPSSLRGKRPNILFVISDDHSWRDVGAYGESLVNTPNIDRLAQEGIRFNHAYVSVPSCAPSRAAILTGRNFWELGTASVLWGIFSTSLQPYTALLQKAGYKIGFEGKGYDPAAVQGGGQNPAGPQVAFQNFLSGVDKNTPFCFWLGTTLPHRSYDQGIGQRSGKDPAKVKLPPHLPDSSVVRNDMLDYFQAVDQLDRQIGRALSLLQEKGLANDTLVVMAGDNGASFPRAKATLYDHGTRVPLVLRWPAAVKAGRVVDDFVNLIDLAPTFLELAGVAVPSQMTAQSLLPVLASPADGRVDPQRDRVFFGVNRHIVTARDGHKGYPARGIRTHDFLFIRNYRPQLWPAGNPGGYTEIDAAPSKDYLVSSRSRHPDIFNLALAIRPGEELYDLQKDPDQIYNVARDERYGGPKAMLSQALEDYLKKTGDPVAAGNVTIMDNYPSTKPNQPGAPGPVPPTEPFYLKPPF